VIVLDASVLANLLGDDGNDGARAREVLSEAAQASVPDLADAETAAVLRKRWLSGHLTVTRFGEALDDLAAPPLDRYPTLPLLPRAFELRANVTVYDSTYVALAEALGCPLVTADARLVAATGPRCPIQLLANTT
jgi:predicted nucleic acid-binding protein